MAIDPAVNVARAAQAYNQVQQTGITSSQMPQQDTTPSNSGAFAALVNNQISEAQAVTRRGEEMSILGLQGKVDMASVVTAVSEAELTLQTVVAIRDKVVDAYREILRMPM